jgi:hypothetical protein
VSNRRVIRRAVVALATSLLIGCSGTTPSLTAAPSATPVATPIPSHSADSTKAPSPTPAAAPSTPTSSTSGPAKPLVVDWTRRAVAGLTGLTEIRASVSGQGAMLLLGTLGPNEDAQGPSTIWRSTNGRDWDPVLEPPIDQRLVAITAGGPGFVAVGTDDRQAVVWTSRDGQRWRQIVDDSFDRGSMQTVVATRSGVVAFGHRWDTDSRVIWTSPDGIQWLAATNETGLRVARGLEAVASTDGRAIAFVGAEADQSGPVEVWETTGRAEWRKIATLQGAGNAVIFAATTGPRGWVALGSSDPDLPDAAWFSEDGTAWGPATTGPDVRSAVIGVDAGFVATGSRGSLQDETCGDRGDYHGHTWTSSDGRVWQRMHPSADFEWASISTLQVVGFNLVGMGGRYPGEHLSSSFVPTRWTASLPADSRPDSPPDRVSEPHGCGG